MLAKVLLFEKRVLKEIIIEWALGHLAQDLYKYSYNYSNSRKYFLPFFNRARKKLNLNLPFDKQISNLAHQASGE